MLAVHAVRQNQTLHLKQDSNPSQGCSSQELEARPTYQPPSRARILRQIHDTPEQQAHSAPLSGSAALNLLTSIRESL